MLSGRADEWTDRRIHTHTSIGSFGFSQVEASALQMELCGRPLKLRKTALPPPPLVGDIRVSPKKGSPASWFMLRWERLRQEQWHFCKTPLCSGATRRGFPSGPSLVPLPLTCQPQQPHGVLWSDLSSEIVAQKETLAGLTLETPLCLDDDSSSEFTQLFLAGSGLVAWKPSTPDISWSSHSKEHSGEKGSDLSGNVSVPKNLNSIRVRCYSSGLGGGEKCFPRPH